MLPKSIRLVALVLLLLVLATTAAHATYGYCAYCGEPFQLGDPVVWISPIAAVYLDCWGSWYYATYGIDPPWHMDPTDVPWGG
jgi:hypothetical protein